jgi:hypothetical protein
MSDRISAIATGICLHILAAGAFAQSFTLHQGQYLFTGQKLVAPGCYFETVMQNDGNLVTYTNANNPGQAWWASGTQNVGGYATLQDDNNFVIYNWADQPVWATGTNEWGADRLVQQDDGNLVLYSLVGDQPFWNSGHYGEGVGQSPCEATAVATQVILDTNLQGADYNHFTIPVARPSWCGYYCAQDAKCQAYTYVPPDVPGTSAACWLKTGIPQPRGATGMVSGFKVWER